MTTCSKRATPPVGSRSTSTCPDIAAAPPAADRPHGTGSTQGTGGPDSTENMVMREVDAEVDGRRYRVKLWVPDTPATSQPAPRSKRGPAVSRPRGAAAPVLVADGTVAVPMQGTIIKVLVTEGEVVEADQTICVLEAMKMGEPDQCRPSRDGERAARLGPVTRSARATSWRS